MRGREEGADLLERRREPDVDLAQAAEFVRPGHSLLPGDAGPGAQAAHSRRHVQQALRFPQVRFQGLGRRDVPRGAAVPGEPVVLVEDGLAADGHVHRRPAGANPDALQLAEDAVRLHVQAVPGPGSVDRSQPGDVPAAQPERREVRPPAALLRMALEGDEPELVVLLPVPARGQQRQAAKPRFALAQRLLRPLATGDVLRLDDEMSGLAASAAHQGAALVRPDELAIATAIAHLAAKAGLCSGQAAATLAQIGGLVLGMQGHRAARDEVLLGIAGQFAERPVRAQRPSIRRHQQGADRRMVECAGVVVRRAVAVAVAGGWERIVFRFGGGGGGVGSGRHGTVELGCSTLRRARRRPADLLREFS